MSSYGLSEIAVRRTRVYATQRCVVSSLLLAESFDGGAFKLAHQEPDNCDEYGDMPANPKPVKGWIAATTYNPTIWRDVAAIAGSSPPYGLAHE